MTEQKTDTKTNVVDFIGELNAGILIEQLGIMLSEAGLATILHGKGTKKGKVDLGFTLTQIGDNEQVLVTVKLSKSVPTKRGKKSEENASDTPFFVGKGGKLTIDLPKNSITGQFDLQQQIEQPSKVRSIKP